MWAAKHCSILFSSVLHQPERFYACTQAKTHAHNLFGVDMSTAMNNVVLHPLDNAVNYI
jgi:hypothetical protein